MNSPMKQRINNRRPRRANAFGLLALSAWGMLGTSGGATARPVSMLRVPQQVVYLSQAGVRGQNSIDESAAVQAVLDRNKTSRFRLLVIDDLPSLLVSGLTINSNTTLQTQPRCVWHLKDWSDRPLLWNAHREGLPANRVDHDISVIGGNFDFDGYANADSSGSQRQHPQINFTPGLTPAPSRTGVTTADTNMTVTGIAFSGVTHLVIQNVHVVKPARFYCLGLSNCNMLQVQNTWLDNTGQVTTRVNSDGVHLWGFNTNGVILNTTGGYGDDVVCINADDSSAAANPEINGNYQAYTSTYDGDPGSAVTDGTGGSNPGPYALSGPCSSILIDGIALTNSQVGLRLLSGVSRMDNITVRNITGTARSYCVDAGANAGSTGGNGNFGTVVIENVNPYVTTHLLRASDTGGTVNINGNFENLTLRNISETSPIGGYPLIFFHNYAIDHLTLDNIVSSDDTGAGSQAIVFVQGTTINQMQVLGADWYTSNPPAGASFLDVSSGSIQSLVFGAYSGPAGRALSGQNLIYSLTTDAFITPSSLAASVRPPTSRRRF